MISVLSHVIPAQLAQLANRAQNGDESARAGFEKYKKLVDLLFIESNPIPVKMALYLMGIIASPELRLPLVPLSAPYTAELNDELKRLVIL